MAIIRLLLVSLGLCLLHSTAYALSGAQTAALLNARYSSTPTQCVARTPAFACSGILLRVVADNQPPPFWALAAGNTTLPFVFVRKDRAGTGLNTTFGYVLFDRLSALAHGKPYQGTATPSEVMVSDWNAQAPDSLPIQGLYYEVSKGHGLLGAQRSQLAYFKATGVWLPVLRLQLDALNGKVFGFSQQDQVQEGYRVAQRLNARYAETRMTCQNGKPSFDCNGVLLRSTGLGDFHAWNPSPYSVGAGGVSYSYLRRDTSVTVVVWPQGYLIRELAAPAAYPMSVGCFFPADGATVDSRTTNACTFRGWCDLRNPPVDSVAGWKANFGGNFYSSCAFRPAPKYVQLMVDVRRNHPGLSGWNEIMVNTWPQNIAPKLPIEAFFYSLSSHYEPGAIGALAGGQRFQRDYFQQTGRTLPLITLDVLASNGQPFSFDPTVQALP